MANVIRGFLCPVCETATEEPRCPKHPGTAVIPFPTSQLCLVLNKGNKCQVRLWNYWCDSFIVSTHARAGIDEELAQNILVELSLSSQTLPEDLEQAYLKALKNLKNPGRHPPHS